MIYLVPPLPVKNRYTEDWIKVWERELKKLGKSYVVVGSKKVESLTMFFTNPQKALIYECKQIEFLAKTKVDKLLCLDIDFPGLITSAIQVLRLTNPDLVAYGYLHAGSWCNGDIFKSTAGKSFVERAMFDTFDKIFVATNYHKQKIERYFGKEFKNLEVVGYPFYKEDILRYANSHQKKSIILISGRPEQSDMGLVDRIKKKFSKEKIIVNPKCKTRKDYFQLLSKAKIFISLKTEETFGLSVLEACTLGTLVLCPNLYSYPEILKNEFLLYENGDDLLSRLENLLRLRHVEGFVDLEEYRQTIFRIVKDL